MSAPTEPEGAVVLHTRSGSEYVVSGGEVRRVGDPIASYILVNLGEQHLRYSDGARIYVSSPLVSRERALTHSA